MQKKEKKFIGSSETTRVDCFTHLLSFAPIPFCYASFGTNAKLAKTFCYYFCLLYENSKAKENTKNSKYLLKQQSKLFSGTWFLLCYFRTKCKASKNFLLLALLFSFALQSKQLLAVRSKAAPCYVGTAKTFFCKPSPLLPPLPVLAILLCYFCFANFAIFSKQGSTATAKQKQQKVIYGKDATARNKENSRLQVEGKSKPELTDLSFYKKIPKKSLNCKKKFLLLPCRLNRRRRLPWFAKKPLRFL